MPEEVSQTTIITNVAGIHARPAVKISKTAKTFASEISLSSNGGDTWTSAKSTNAVIKMRARLGASLVVKAAGADANEAVEAIVKLVEIKFGEA
jgi:phosphocarrier protein HPr